jgi:pilus assembly protein CpaD
MAKARQLGRTTAPAAGVAVLVGALVLGGCDALNGLIDLDTTGSLPAAAYASNHPITVAEAPVHLDIVVGMGSQGLLPGDQARIAAFAADAKVNATTRIIIQRPVGTGNVTVASAVAVEARDALVHAGIPVGNVNITTYQGEAGSVGIVRLTYYRISAIPSECSAAWGTTSGGELGCATQANLAAMIADPSDLVSPAGEH